MRGSIAERTYIIMTNAEATNADKPAAVAALGAHGAPEKASSKKGASKKKGAVCRQNVVML
jgi:hypothetical protein